MNKSVLSVAQPLRAVMALFILPLIVTLVGCGGSPQEQIEPDETKVKSSALDGTWQLGCQPDGSVYALSDFVDNYIIISNGRYIRIQRGFSASKTDDPSPCTNGKLLYTLQEKGLFLLKKNVNNVLLEDPEKWSAGDWGTLQSAGQTYSMTPLHIETAMKWNAAKLFDSTRWEIGKSKSVTNKKLFGSRIYLSSPKTEAVRLEAEADGAAYFTLGVLPDNDTGPVFHTNLRYKRLATLPFSFKEPDQNDTYFIKGN